MPCPVLTKPATRNLPCRAGKLREKNRIRPRNHLAHRQLPIFLKYLRVRDRAERTCSQGRRRETLARSPSCRRARFAPPDPAGPALAPPILRPIYAGGVHRMSTKFFVCPV